MNLKIFVLVGVLLTGCASGPTPIKCETQIVKVPVVVPPPAPPTIVSPHLPITDLTNKSPPGDTAVAYKATVVLLENVIKQYELVLQKYDDLSKAK